MSVVGDAITAIKKVLLLEDRIQSQGRKLEQLSTIVVDMDKRLAHLEGFIAGASARQHATRRLRGPADE